MRRPSTVPRRTARSASAETMPRSTTRELVWLPDEANSSPKFMSRPTGYANRRGRTTVVTTVSPLWLHHADRVVLLSGGRVVAEGRHADLLAGEPDYRDLVIRTMEDTHA